MNSVSCEKAILEFSKILKERLSVNLKKLILFGSVARGTNADDSDIDILVIVDSVDLETDDILTDVMFDVNLKYDVVICPLLITESNYLNSLFRETPFYRSLKNDGIPLT